jgi:hypothetical protein
MRRSLTFSVVIVAALAAGVSSQRSPAVGIRALATVRELHDIMISPASDAVFAASSNQPLDAKGWTDARNQAILLAESGNLLMTGTRVRDNGNWMKMSRAMVDAAALAAAAAEKKDARGLEAATDSITTACMECHRPYRDGGRQMGAPK